MKPILRSLLSGLLLATMFACFTSDLRAQDGKATEAKPAPVAACESPCDDPVTGVKWAPDIWKAMERAKAESKPVLIVFSVRYMGDPFNDKH